VSDTTEVTPRVSSLDYGPLYPSILPPLHLSVLITLQNPHPTTMSTAFRSAFAAASRRPASALSSAPIAPARTGFQAHGQAHARFRGFSTTSEAYAGVPRGPGAFRRWTTRFGELLNSF
jgi:hypothetical protein